MPERGREGRRGRGGRHIGAADDPQELSPSPCSELDPPLLLLAFPNGHLLERLFNLVDGKCQQSGSIVVQVDIMHSSGLSQNVSQGLTNMNSSCVSSTH